MHGKRTAMPLAARDAAVSWPPLMVIHGSADRVVSRTNARAAAQAWAAAAGARPDPSRNVQRGKRYPMTVTDFKLRSATVATLVEGGTAGPCVERRPSPASRTATAAARRLGMMWSFAARQFRG